MRATILHGTDGNPNINWLPWLKSLLLSKGYEVFVPLLPENHTPNRFTYDAFLREQDWDYKDNLLVGHSSGATSVLNLLSSDWFPHVQRTVLVGTFLNENLLSSASWFEKGQFDQLFPDTFDTKKIKQLCDDFVFIHGDNDPYCSFADALNLCTALEGQMISVKNGLHLSSNRADLNEILPFV